MDQSWIQLLTKWEIPPVVTAVLVATAVVYARGWRRLRQARNRQLQSWRPWAFFAGLVSIFVAVASPLDTFSESLIFMHMAQHFVLMSIAPPLILLGSPFLTILRGLPRTAVRHAVRPLLRRRWWRRTGALLVQPPVAWLAMNLTYLGWHVPAAYEFALQSEGWHNFEHLCFYVTNVQFWWPIVHPWPAAKSASRWFLIPYLLLADLVNTGLSAFLCFSGRLLYPSYGQIDRPFGIEALRDQMGAGAFMWIFGSAVFLIALVAVMVGPSPSPAMRSHTWRPGYASAGTAD